MTMFQNRFYLRGDTALVLNRSMDGDLHSHYALQITLALSEPFGVRFQDSDWEDFHALLIDSSCAHQYSSKEQPQVIILLNPLSVIGHSLRRKFLGQAGEPSAQLSGEATGILRDALRDFPEDKGRILECLDLYFAELLGDWREEPVIHEKILLVLEIMNGLSEKKISLEKLADRVFLSESHLVHLFKKNTGVPIRRHLMWLRTLEAVNFLTSGKGNLTMAAHEAGFSDSAHFSRTFKLMFGISPGEFMNKHEFGLD